MVTTFFIAHNIIHYFSDAQGQLTPKSVMESWQNSKIVQALSIIVLVTYKNEEDPSKNVGTRVVTTFLPLLVNGDFSRCSRAANSVVPCQILPNFEPIQDFMAVLVTCKNKEEPIKN